MKNKHDIKGTLDTLFSKKHRKEIEKKHEEEVKDTDNQEEKLKSKKEKAKRKLIKAQRALVKQEMKDEIKEKRRVTKDGYKIYSLEELNVGKGGDTEDCPFDCQCCF